MPPAPRKAPPRATAYDASPLSRLGRWRAAAKPLWLECGLLFGLAFASTFSLRAWVVEARYVPSSSMKPTFEENDRLLVEKLSRGRSPRRGEVVVFHPPARATEAAGPLIKRVVAIGGDQVEVRAGQLWVNGRAQREPYAERIDYPNPDWEGLGMSEGRVPEGHFLPLGDHRNASLDGHAFGPVPNHHLIGRPLLRLWPPDRIGGSGAWNSTRRR